MPYSRPEAVSGTVCRTMSHQFLFSSGTALEIMFLVSFVSYIYKLSPLLYGYVHCLRSFKQLFTILYLRDVVTILRQRGWVFYGVSCQICADMYPRIDILRIATILTDTDKIRIVIFLFKGRRIRIRILHHGYSTDMHYAFILFFKIFILCILSTLQ